MLVEIGGSTLVDLTAGQRPATICAFRIALGYRQATISPAIPNGELEDTGGNQFPPFVIAGPGVSEQAVRSAYDEP